MTRMLRSRKGIILLAALALLASAGLMLPRLPKPLSLKVQVGEAAQVEATPAAPPAEPVPGSGVLFDAGSHVVNLADPGGYRYLKASLVIEFAPPEDSPLYELEGEAREREEQRLAAELERLRPIISDTLTGVLSSKTFIQVFTLDAKVQLKREMATALEARLPDLGVRHIYFGEFVIQ